MRPVLRNVMLSVTLALGINTGASFLAHADTPLDRVKALIQKETEETNKLKKEIAKAKAAKENVDELKKRLNEELAKITGKAVVRDFLVREKTADDAIEFLKRQLAEREKLKKEGHAKNPKDNDAQIEGLERNIEGAKEAKDAAAAH